MPWLLFLLARWISLRASFLTLFPRHGSPSATVSHALQSVASTYSLQLPLFQSHALRRGTLSLLWRFGMPQEDINPHMGWAYGSVEFQKYYHLVNAV